jgi:DNA-binding transcriptional MerR regulator
MSTIPDNLAKRYYTLREVGAMFGVTKSLIRYWEKKFDYLRPYVSSGGERRYTAENIRQFQTIYQLVKEKGYTLQGARKYLKEERRFLKQKQESLQTLRRLRGFLEDLKFEL